jgi:hypothetical protein
MNGLEAAGINQSRKPHHGRPAAAMPDTELCMFKMRHWPSVFRHIAIP